MLKRYHHIVGGSFRLIDAILVGGIWLAAYGLRFQLPVWAHKLGLSTYFGSWFTVTKGFPPFQKYAALTPLVVALWLVLFTSMRVYKPARMLRRTQEAFTVLRAHLSAMVLFLALTYLFSEYRYSRGVMIYFGVTGAFALVSLRLIVRNFLRKIRRSGFNLRYVLAVGEGSALEFLLQRLEKFPELGLRVVGAVVHEKTLTPSIAGKPVLGHFNDLLSILRKVKPDQLLIALPREQSADLDALLRCIQDEIVDIQLVPDLHDYVTLGCQVEDFDGLPIVHLNDSPLDGWGAIAKRATDLVATALGMILISPLLVFIALAVKLTSKGPVLYSQERMGLDGRTFKMYKFRSMKIDAESKSGAVWARAADDRRTLIGGILRATSLDELPQLFNVFLGHMSLVGPRPERPVFVDQFRNEIPHYMLRHKTKAGMTGWAQVNGWRGNTSLSRRIECDLYYIRNWSYWLDVKILWLTLWKGFMNKNAY